LQIVIFLQPLRRKVIHTISLRLVLAFFEIDRMIVEEEQNEKDRAEYGKKSLKDPSRILKKNLLRGFR